MFGSGYMTNAGTIPSLVERGDEVFADRLVHASIIDAIVLSRAKLVRFHHNDAEHLEILLRTRAPVRRRLVVTESVFSMDGDLAPLAEIAAVATRNGAMLMVDEAHGTGMFGPHGSGRVSSLGLQQAVNVSMGTLSKAIGSHGGFVACSPQLRNLLLHRARSFIYTTALPPASVAAALATMSILEEQPDLGKSLLERADLLRKLLQEGGLDTGMSQSQIIPVMIGDPRRVMVISEELSERGIVAVAIRPPTVPRGSARLRMSVTLAHTMADIRRAAETVIETVRRC